MQWGEDRRNNKTSKFTVKRNEKIENKNDEKEKQKQWEKTNKNDEKKM